MNKKNDNSGHIISLLTYNAIISGELARFVNCMMCIPQSNSIEQMTKQLFIDEHGIPRVHFALLQEVGDPTGWNDLCKQLRPYYPHQSPQTNDLGVLAVETFPFRTEQFMVFPKTLSFYAFGTMVIHFSNPQYKLSVLNVHPTAESIDWGIRRSDLIEIRKRLDDLRKRFPDRGIIFAGDFNTHLTDPHFKELVEILGVPMNQPIDPENSFYAGGYDQNQSHIPKESNKHTADSSRLDYIWVFSSLDGKVQLSKLGERVLRGVRTSDHKPIISYIKIVEIKS